MKKNVSLWISIVALLAPCNIYASDNVNTFKDIYLKKAIEANKSTLQLEAFSEKKIGKLTTRYSDGGNLYTFVVQGAIDEDSKKGTFADLDGLKNGTKVTLNYSRIFFNNSSIKSLANASVNACNKNLGKKKQAIGAEIKICRANNKADADKLGSEAEREALYAVRCESLYKKDKSLPTQCSDSDGYKDVMTSVLKKADLSTHRVGLELGVGSEKFKWVDASSLASEKDTESSYSIEGQYGYINNKYQRFNIGYRYEEKWKGQKAQSLCKPYAASPGSLTCESVAIGPPEETESRITYIEWKQYYGEKDNAAFSVKLSHDSETDVTGIDIPIYLYQEKKSKGLQGGVRLGWISDEDTTDNDKHDDDVIFSIFFNAGFSIKD